MQSPAEQVQPEGGHRNEERIDVDGLPHVGTVIYPGQAYYSRVDCATGMLGRPCCTCSAQVFSELLSMRVRDGLVAGNHDYIGGNV